MTLAGAPAQSPSGHTGQQCPRALATTSLACPAVCFQFTAGEVGGPWVLVLVCGSLVAGGLNTFCVIWPLECPLLRSVFTRLACFPIRASTFHIDL